MKDYGLELLLLFFAFFFIITIMRCCVKDFGLPVCVCKRRQKCLLAWIFFTLSLHSRTHTYTRARAARILYIYIYNIYLYSIPDVRLSRLAERSHLSKPFARHIWKTRFEYIEYIFSKVYRRDKKNKKIKTYYTMEFYFPYCGRWNFLNLLSNILLLSCPDKHRQTSENLNELRIYSRILL